MASALVMPREVFSPPGINSIVEPSKEESTVARVLPSQLQPGQNSLVFPFALVEPTIHRSAVPDKVLFGALRSPSLQLRQAIPLRIERGETGINVVWEGEEEFGSGDTFSEAIDDFSHTITELYLGLSDASNSYSGHLLSVRERLSHYITPRTR
jgi:hypothetical protein